LFQIHNIPDIGSTAMSQEFKFDVDENQLLFITEIMVFIYIIIKFEKSFALPCSVGDNLILFEMTSSIEDTLKDLLRKPLQQKRFRQCFNEHFRDHPNDLLNTLGMEVLNEVLVFETD